MRNLSSGRQYSVPIAPIKRANDAVYIEFHGVNSSSNKNDQTGDLMIVYENDVDAHVVVSN